jgi:hypothetical protein
MQRAAALVWQARGFNALVRERGAAAHAPFRKSCTYGAAEKTAMPVTATAAAEPPAGTTVPLAEEPSAAEATGSPRTPRGRWRGRRRSAGPANLASCAPPGAADGRERHASAVAVGA